MDIFSIAGILKRVRVEGGVSQALLDTTVNATSGYAALSDFVIFTGAKARLQKLVLRTGDIEPINIPMKRVRKATCGIDGQISFRWNSYALYRGTAGRNKRG